MMAHHISRIETCQGRIVAMLAKKAAKCCYLFLSRRSNVGAAREPRGQGLLMMVKKGSM